MTCFGFCDRPLHGRIRIIIFDIRDARWNLQPVATFERRTNQKVVNALPPLGGELK